MYGHEWARVISQLLGQKYLFNCIAQKHSHKTTHMCPSTMSLRWPRSNSLQWLLLCLHPNFGIKVTSRAGSGKWQDNLRIHCDIRNEVSHRTLGICQNDIGFNLKMSLLAKSGMISI